MWIGSLGSPMFWGTCATNFSIFPMDGGCRAENFRHRGQIKTGTMPKKLCKPGLNLAILNITLQCAPNTMIKLRIIIIPC